MHQSFVSTAPLGNSGVRFVVKIPTKSPGSPEGNINVEQKLGVVLHDEIEIWGLGLNFCM